MEKCCRWEVAALLIVAVVPNEQKERRTMTQIVPDPWCNQKCMMDIHRLLAHKRETNVSSYSRIARDDDSLSLLRDVVLVLVRHLAQHNVRSGVCR